MKYNIDDLMTVSVPLAQHMCDHNHFAMDESARVATSKPVGGAQARRFHRRVAPGVMGDGSDNKNEDHTNQDVDMELDLDAALRHNSLPAGGSSPAKASYGMSSAVSVSYTTDGDSDSDNGSTASSLTGMEAEVERLVAAAASVREKMSGGASPTDGRPLMESPSKRLSPQGNGGGGGDAEDGAGSGTGTGADGDGDGDADADADAGTGAGAGAGAGARAGADGAGSGDPAPSATEPVAQARPAALPADGFTAFCSQCGAKLHSLAAKPPQEALSGAQTPEPTLPSTVVALARGERLCFVGSVRLRVLAGSVRVLGTVLSPECPWGGDEYVSMQAPPWEAALVIHTEWDARSDPTVAIATQVDRLPATTRGPAAAVLAAGGSDVSAVIQLQQASHDAPTWLAQYNLAPSAEEIAINSEVAVPGFHLLLHGAATSDAAGNAPAPTPRGPKRKVAGASYTCLRRPIVIARRWDAVAAAVRASHVESLKQHGPVTALVCGSKVSTRDVCCLERLCACPHVVHVLPQGVGKSTFVRFLVNSLLTVAPAVAVLDLDLGQPELGPPGIMALHVVGAPLLTPPHAHLQQQHRCVDTGCNSAPWGSALTPCGPYVSLLPMTGVQRILFRRCVSQGECVCVWACVCAGCQSGAPVIAHAGIACRFARTTLCCTRVRSSPS